MNHYNIHPIAPPREGILLAGHKRKGGKRRRGLEGTAVLKCGVEGVVAKPYPGDITPGGSGGGSGIEGTRDGWPGEGGVKPVDPDWFTCGIEGTTAKSYPDGGDIIPGGGGIYPLPPWPKGGTEEITVRTDEKWGGGNCHEGYYDLEDPGGGTGCSGCSAEGFEGFGG